MYPIFFVLMLLICDTEGLENINEKYDLTYVTYMLV